MAELGDVQGQPSDQVQHGLKPVEKIGMRPEQETVAVIDSTLRNDHQGQSPDGARRTPPLQSDIAGSWGINDTNKIRL